ncbi:hypothetical protein HQ563_08690 [bacterium]|nr:hypothetical protein [bacterium]
MNRFQLAGVILGTLLAGGHVNGEISAPEGYDSWETEVAGSAWSGGFDLLPDGRLIVSDNVDVFVLDAEGIRTVAAHFETPGLFGSFVKVAPDGQTVYVGESSVGTISSFDINAAGVQPIGPGTESVVAQVELNYDLEFDHRGRAFVSAGTPGTWQPDRLLLLDPETGGTDLVATVQGNSGPLAFDEEGNLFYSTSTSYPPEPVESVIFFPPDKIDGAIVGDPLTDSDAETYVSGIYGFTDMVFDGDGDLFGVTSSGQIVEIAEEGGGVSSRRFASVSPDALGATVVRFLPGERAFEPYYQDGGTLTFMESDFGSFFRLVHVESFPEFRMISVEPSSEGVKVGFATEADKQYQVYWCDGLANGSGWEAVGDAVTGDGQPTVVLDTGDDKARRPVPNLESVRRRFYRIGTVQ